jgi:acyl-CoA thioester hydrolase
MQPFTTEVRVRYAETDRMGFVYYGNYATYFEVARVEALRELGITYKALEDQGVLLPVRDFSISYKRPGHYDDLLRIETLVKLISPTSIAFDYQTYRDVELLNTASTILVFVNAESGKPMRCPQPIADRLNA